MVTKIIGVGDIHIRNLKRLKEYKLKLERFIDVAREISSSNGNENTRIVVTGDVFHSKTDISPEAYYLASWFIRSLGHIAKTIVIAGNHDMSANEERMDPLTTIFSISSFDNVYYLDQACSYDSSCMKDENIVWCLYSAFNGFSKPKIEEYKVKYPELTYVGLFHGCMKNAKTDAGYQSETGMEPSYFDGIDFGIFGHIHKRQCIKYHGIPLVYCGSLIQQDFGENLSGHGFVVFDVESKTYDSVDFTDEEYGFYNFKIEKEDDIENDLEEIINL